MLKISDEEGKRVDRFLAAFNLIEAELKKNLGLESHIGFREASSLFSQRHGWWRVHDQVMVTVAQIRNFLVHTRSDPAFVAAVPHEDMVLRLERTAAMLVRPKLVIPTFQKEVMGFRPEQPLTDLLSVVQSSDVTFFPISGDDGFLGLVTGNGLMRWLAKLADEDPLNDLSEISIGEVLELEEPRTNYAFVSRTTPAYEAIDLFSQKAGLEAVLITHEGRKTESLLGIVTVWDVANVELN